jgi:hypothetical protein
MLMMKDVHNPPEGQIIASMVSPQEYAALQERSERILAKIPEKWKTEPRSRTMRELFQSIDESFKIVASRKRKKSS